MTKNTVRGAIDLIEERQNAALRTQSSGHSTGEGAGHDGDRPSHPTIMRDGAGRGGITNGRG